MKIKCENLVVCGAYACACNDNGYCAKAAVALDAEGKCVLFRPKYSPKPLPNPNGEKPNEF